MIDKKKSKMYTVLIATKMWVIRHVIILCGLSLFFLGGIPLAIVGVLSGFFIETLIKRLKKDNSLEASIENPFNIKSSMTEDSLGTDEPFEGALLVGALGVYCTGNPDFAGLQMQKQFSKQYRADWVSLCRIASLSKSLNGDLITECLAATLIKVLQNSDNEALLIQIFSFLSVVEYDWNEERGIKPSEYLAELLHRPMFSQNNSVEELEKAYSLLGVSSTDSLDKIKAAHRSFVSLYHPDTLRDFSEEQKKIAAEAFLRIQTAYEHILASKN